MRTDDRASKSSSTIRVLHVLGRMNRGGAELRTIEVLRHLAATGIRADVLALSGESGELDDEIVRLGGQVILLRRGLGFQHRLRNIMRTGGYAAVHSHVHHYSGVLLRAAERVGIPVRVAQFHSLNDGRGDGMLRGLYRWWMHRLIENHATTILGVSRSVLAANWPAHLSDARCQVIYNGIDEGAFSHSRPRDEVRREILGDEHASQRMIIHVGNLTPPKNHDLLLAAFDALAYKRPDVWMVMVGRGDSAAEERLRKQMASCRHSSRMRYLGGRDDVPSLLLAADAFLFPSVREGLPGALVEACAAGLPCLASDIAPCREVAERLPQIRLQDVASGSGLWSTMLDQVMSTGVRLNPAAALDQVRAVGFSVSEASRRYAAIWRGEGA